MNGFVKERHYSLSLKPLMGPLTPFGNGFQTHKPL